MYVILIILIFIETATADTGKVSELPGEIIFAASKGDACICPPAPWFIWNGDSFEYGYSMVTYPDRSDHFIRIAAFHDNIFSSGYIARYLQVKPDTSYNVSVLIRRIEGEANLGIIHEEGEREIISRISWANNSIVPEFVPLELVHGHIANSPLVLKLKFKTSPNEKKIRLFIGLVRYRGILEIEKISLAEDNPAIKGD